MSSSVRESLAALAIRVSITSDTLTVDLADGRTISVPIEWYPRLAHATMKERKTWRLIGNGLGIHWHELDEDISVANLLAGQRSNESSDSIKRWLDSRSKEVSRRRRTK